MYRLLAALQPRMLALSAEKAAGAHTYLVTPEHTATAREILGPKPVLAPEQMVILQDDPAEARRIARLYLAPYLAQPNYQNSLRRLGFTDDDFEGEGTDGLIDALVAWGDEDAILKRVQAHRDAGADHVCVQPLADPTQGFPIASIRRLSEHCLPPDRHDRRCSNRRSVLKPAWVRESAVRRGPRPPAKWEPSSSVVSH
jgi:probable F420-dependent oxidoreductase